MSVSAVRSIAVAAKGKGAVNLARRVRTIGSHYGIGPGRMERRLADVLRIAERYGCRVTLPVTAAAVERNPRVVARYAELGIEFAVHGLRHVDHAGLRTAEQIEQLGRARRILERYGIQAVGFRAPYLRWNEATLEALRENGFLYDSSQAMHWPIDERLGSDGYRRALTFYGALSATEHPSVPRIEEGLVRIPCAIPDDEAAVDRLRLSTPGAIADVWLDVFRRSYRRGELFTLAVHPERIELCGPAITAVLDAARTARPAVWIARLDQIARWWRERAAAAVALRDGAAGWLHLDVQGPDGLVVLANDIELPGAERLDDGTLVMRHRRFDVRASVRPFIGVHPASPAALTAFLREQGYIVEVTDRAERYGHFLRRERFSPEDRLPLLRDLDVSRVPLVRFGRWPGGARSALSVTGDVDALTIWDYASRFLGR